MKYVSALAASALALTISAALVGCGGNTSSTQEATQSETVEQVASEAETEETGEATSELADGAVFNAATMQEVAEMPYAYLDRGNSDYVIYFAITDDATRAAR